MSVAAVLVDCGSFASDDAQAARTISAGLGFTLTPMPVSARVRRHYDGRALTYDDNEMHTGLAATIAEWLDLEGNESILDVATRVAGLLDPLASIAL